MSRARRVAREMEDVRSDQDAGITIQALNDADISHLKGTFHGPPGTPYQGGTFVVDIQIPNDYPFKPPRMKFDTRIYHPNISSQTGAICLDILKDAWSPVFTLKSSLISLQSLLQSAEPNDPQDAEVAKIYLTDKAAFERTAAEWTARYAGGAAGGDQDEISRLGLDRASVEGFAGMGFPKEKIVAVFKKLQIKKPQSPEDEQRVVEELLN
ncbi:Ubiquitin-conjugating enzyme E2 1 [Yarrowia sp. B02]|nr:Ubiquitin-conjugating enzyme E2 1 [Yarrowia sp. B02]